MIRKTLICVAGVVAGASTGAYVDGFFEEENIVTSYYHKMVGEFSPSVDADANNPSSADQAAQGIAAMAQGNKDMSGSGGKVDGGQSGSGTSQPDGSPSAGSSDKLASAKSADASNADAMAIKNGMAKVADPKVSDSNSGSALKPNRTTDPSADPSKSQSPQGLTEQKMAAKAETKRDPANVTPAPKSEPKTAAQQEAQKQADMEKARSLALLDVRFTKETFQSPSGGELKYRKLIPRFASNSKLPLVIFLHGSGERGDDNVSQLKHGLAYFASLEGMREFPATVIAPQCPKDMRWSNTLSEDRPENPELEPEPTSVLRMTQELIRSLKATDNIDPDRVYVTGLSMGGFGTFDLLARQPSAYAAAVALCGGGDTRPEIVDRIKQTPLWIVHGDQDSSVDVKYSRNIVEALRSAGSEPRYSELKGFGHNVWDVTYSDKELYNWMFDQSKSKTKKSKKSSFASATAAKPSLGQAISGNWTVLAATQRGHRANDATLEKMKVEIKGGNLGITIDDKQEVAKFELPSSNGSPYPFINILSQAPSIKDSAGIFAVQGDKLVLCWSMPGDPRPTTFASKEGVKTLVLQKK